MKFSNSGFLFLIVLLFSCSKKPTTTGPIIEPPVLTIFAKGADVSWVTQMESQGIKFYNKSGVQQDLLAILKDLGMNTIRLRAWVNPTDGWCNTADLLAKAIRAKNAGFRILIDFHYSDSWADPGKQTKPLTWQNESVAQLSTSIKDYTTTVLTLLKQNNVFPEWVQVGNETNNGMLWPEGKASDNMANFAMFVNAGYDAAKAVFPSTSVIVHVSNGEDNSLFRWMFDGLKNNGAKWDVIGMSLYPSAASWPQLNSQCLSNMNDMVSRYNKPVMICEIGMPVTDSSECKKFIADIVSKTKSLSGNKGLGVLYWEPECYNNFAGYGLGAFWTDGRPTSALDGFQ
ncbi:MAG: glycosyl hydrolase 53 family protein [Bacteroidetes bacterium]|nr:glycosyl hydrolase 53 family protein [Bacteroidota bacterium]